VRPSDLTVFLIEINAPGRWARSDDLPSCRGKIGEAWQ